MIQLKAFTGYLERFCGSRATLGHDTSSSRAAATCATRHLVPDFFCCCCCCCCCCKLTTGCTASELCQAGRTGREYTGGRLACVRIPVETPRTCQELVDNVRRRESEQAALRDLGVTLGVLYGLLRTPVPEQRPALGSNRRGRATTGTQSEAGAFSGLL